MIGGRLGKMGGGLVVSSLLIVFSQSTLAQLTPILSVVSGLIVFLWIASVRALGQRYEAAVAESEKEKAAASA